MTREDAKLVLKDLCSRLPYGVIALTEKGNGHICDINLTIFGAKIGINVNPAIRDTFSIEDIKPYLFPLSSMTEEQKKEINKRYITSINDYSISIRHHSEGYWDDDTDAGFSDYLWIIDWLNKNHFDYRGLIERGLAIDATELNIY